MKILITQLIISENLFNIFYMYEKSVAKTNFLITKINMYIKIKKG